MTAAGIARTFQNVRLFNEMSVLENVMVGRHVRTRNGLWAALSRHKRAREEEKQTRELAGTGWTIPALRSSPTIAPAIWPMAISVGLKSPARWQRIR